MNPGMKTALRKVTHALGFRLQRLENFRYISLSERYLPMHFDEAFDHIHLRCDDKTMTNPERQYLLFETCRHVCRHRIAGAFVECGVWRGGSSMIAALTFLMEKDVSRELYLYDTFSGMPEPGPYDKSYKYPNDGMQRKWQNARRDRYNAWCYAAYEEVLGNLTSTGYPEHKLKLIKGDVLETIPSTLPDRISILRLDTDFYESTRHEIRHLYNRVSPHGFVIIDDYGAYDGARKAIDEFIAERALPVFLFPIDRHARMLIKPALSDDAMDR